MASSPDPALRGAPLAEPGAGSEPEHWITPLKRWVEIPLLVAFALVSALLIKTFLLQAFYIPSGSMETTLHGCAGCPDNDRVLVWKLGYKFHSINRGDIVVFDGGGSFNDTTGDAPSGTDYIKRVVALEGDVISCCDPQGRILLNATALDEPYVHQDDSQAFAPVTVPPGHVWVMGDHRSNSSDSRVHGPVPIERVEGRAFMIVWPLNRLGTLGTAPR